MAAVMTTQEEELAGQGERRAAGTLASAFSLGRLSLRSGQKTAGHMRWTPRLMLGPEMRVFPGRSLFSLQALLTLEGPS